MRQFITNEDLNSQHCCAVQQNASQVLFPQNFPTRTLNLVTCMRANTCITHHDRLKSSCTRIHWSELRSTEHQWCAAQDNAGHFVTFKSRYELHNPPYLVESKRCLFRSGRPTTLDCSWRVEQVPLENDVICVVLAGSYWKIRRNKWSVVPGSK